MIAKKPSLLLALAPLILASNLSAVLTLTLKEEEKNNKKIYSYDDVNGVQAPLRLTGSINANKNSLKSHFIAESSKPKEKTLALKLLYGIKIDGLEVFSQEDKTSFFKDKFSEKIFRISFASKLINTYLNSENIEIIENENSNNTLE